MKESYFHFNNDWNFKQFSIFIRMLMDRGILVTIQTLLGGEKRSRLLRETTKHYWVRKEVDPFKGDNQTLLGGEGGPGF